MSDRFLLKKCKKRPRHAQVPMTRVSPCRGANIIASPDLQMTESGDECPNTSYQYHPIEQTVYQWNENDDIWILEKQVSRENVTIAISVLLSACLLAGQITVWILTSPGPSKRSMTHKSHRASPHDNRTSQDLVEITGNESKKTIG